jgi:hypothetical protein
MLSIPEHDLERRQRKQCNPNLRIQESFHGSLFVVGLNDVEWRTRRFSELGVLRRFKPRDSLHITDSLT